MSLNDFFISAMMKGVRRHRKYAGRKGAQALRSELQERALKTSADFVQNAMPAAMFCNDKFLHLDCALSNKPDGLIAEFGVYKGRSINHIAEACPDDTVFGFDSFRGLPEHWLGNRFSKKNFDHKGLTPPVRSNVTLIEGWFNESLPAFLQTQAGAFGFVHIDCDIYSSTVTVLNSLESRLAPGAVIVFDEFFNYPGYEQHEYKAFFEFIERARRQFEYIAYSGQSLSVKLA